MKGFSIKNGDSVRLAEAMLGIVKAVDKLPESERADVLRAACTLYDVVQLPAAKPGKKPRPPPTTVPSSGAR